MYHPSLHNVKYSYNAQCYDAVHVASTVHIYIIIVQHVVTFPSDRIRMR